MNKETLKKIRDDIKITIKKMFDDDGEINNYTLSKIEIISNKLLERCNNNHNITQGVFKLAIEELIREASGGDFMYMLKEINKTKKE